MEKGVPIRSVSRCLAVLRCVSQSGPLSMMEIARASRVPYPTACRIVQTLLFEDLVEREAISKRYRATARVSVLSDRFQDDRALIFGARPHLETLTETLLWPAALTTQVGVHMIVRDSTHTLTPLTSRNYFPGFTCPLLHAAAGHACLAFQEDAHRRRLIEEIARASPAADAPLLAMFQTGGRAEQIRAAGFAAHEFVEAGGQERLMGAVAAPLMQDGRFVAALSLTYFTSRVGTPGAVALLGEATKRTAWEISRSAQGWASERRRP